ncbi:MAG TPA: CdaR family protein [bacterium]|nr:CdaR family protein [bacterium]
MRSPKLIRKLNPPGARAKGHTRAQLRRLITENLSLKLFALALAVLMWGFVASQRRGESTEIKFTTPLVFKNIPTNLEVTNAPVQSVGVLVGVQRSLGNSVNPNLFQVSIDLSSQLPGQLNYSLTDKNVSYNNGPPPPGMTVQQISPAVIPITLEEALVKEVPIRPRFFGDLAPGFSIESIQIRPPAAKVQGARSRLDKLDHIYTRPLDLQDLDSNVEMLVELDLPADLRLAPKQENFFHAYIKVTQNVSRALLRDIPVVVENAKYKYKISTTLLNVYLEGPEDVMRKLDKENVFAVLDLSKYPPGDYRGQAPKVVVPDTVKVLEQWPIVDLFVINSPAKPGPPPKKP